ncbi:uncharacterized protein LOC105279348 isoform X2 [Ooceraea biroi]|uniref:uncharacterized protein LOC105279348 isoform X2 n=1 Tax=Ooceraea biroi TaxID=2015173 RepID=UPI0005BD294C|nr:uncharacterized protein LOC105279348 isoform X2 [Ooceraea biroi]
MVPIFQIADRKWALHRTAATKPGDFRRTTAWNVRIATIVHDPWMVCLNSPSSEEGSCIFQDPRRLRGRTFRHDLQRASWKVRGRTVRPHVPWKMDFVIAKGSARDDRDTAVLIKSKHSQVVTSKLAQTTFCGFDNLSFESHQSCIASCTYRYVYWYNIVYQCQYINNNCK